MSTITNPQAPRIVKLTLRRADGKRRRKLVKLPNYERSPNDSIFGLQAKLAQLTVEGTITASAVIVPPTITDAQRDKLTRWPEALDKMLEAE